MNLLDKFIVERRGIWSNAILTKPILFEFFKDFIVGTDELLLDRTQYWSLDQIKKMQRVRIRHILKVAYNHVPRWRKRFLEHRAPPFEIKDFNDFAGIQLTNKIELKTAGFGDLLNRNVPLSECFQDSTSGSTGNPLRFYIDKNYILRSFAFCRRIFKWAGFQKGDKIVRLGIRDRQGFAADYIVWTAYVPEDYERIFSNLIFLNSRLVNGQKILIFSFGSTLLRLAEFVKKRGVKLNLRSIISSGESLLSAERKFIEDALGPPVFNCYAGRETGWLAQECEQGGMHLNPEWAYLEITDAEGRPLPAGVEGKIVVTAFDNEVMPFIRYDTGDSGRILNDRCSCGRTLPLIEFRGREIERIYLSGGRAVDFGEFAFLFERWAGDIVSFQVIQESFALITVNLVVRSPEAFGKSGLVGALKSFLGTDARVEVNLVSEIPQFGEKRRVFISRVNQ